MRSRSSRQWPTPFQFGAEFCTAPRLCISSCAAAEFVAFQQFGPTRAKLGPPLDAFAAPGWSSHLCSEPMPQLTSSAGFAAWSTNTRYLRSVLV